MICIETVLKTCRTLAGTDPAQAPAGGMPMYGEEKPGGPPMMSKGPHVEKDEFGNEIPKGFKSEYGSFKSYYNIYY